MLIPLAVLAARRAVRRPRSSRTPSSATDYEQFWKGALVHRARTTTSSRRCTTSRRWSPWLPTIMMALGFVLALLHVHRRPGRAGAARRAATRSSTASCSTSGTSTSSTTPSSCARPCGSAASSGRRATAGSSTGSGRTASRPACSTSPAASCGCRRGYLYHYAFAMLIGVAALVTWYLCRGSALMFGFGILSGLLVLPLVGAAFILTLRGDDEAVRANARWAALAATVVDLPAVARRLGRGSTPRPGLPARRDPCLARPTRSASSSASTASRCRSSCSRPS